MQYQPLVDTLPRIGRHATNMWYTHYQALVAGLFVCILNIRTQEKIEIKYLSSSPPFILNSFIRIFLNNFCTFYSSFMYICNLQYLFLVNYTSHESNY